MERDRRRSEEPLRLPTQSNIDRITSVTRVTSSIPFNVSYIIQENKRIFKAEEERRTQG